MTEVVPQPKADARRSRRPGPAAVIWGSVALFAVLFALFTYQLSAAPGPPRQHVLVRKLVKRQVITTVVPTPGESSVTAGPVSSTQSTSGTAPIATVAS
jgi:hypothetical protein